MMRFSNPCQEKSVPCSFNQHFTAISTSSYICAVSDVASVLKTDDNCSVLDQGCKQCVPISPTWTTAYAVRLWIGWIYLRDHYSSQVTMLK